MQDLLSKIFDKVAFYEQDSIQSGKEYDSRVEELVEPLRSTMSKDGVEEVKELIYKASYDAEKYGFQMGVRFMTKFIEEAVGIKG